MVFKSVRIVLGLVLLFFLFTIYLPASQSDSFGWRGELRIVSYAQPACDLCGKCEGGDEPSDYDACLQCVYDGNASNTPKEGYSWTVIGCIETSPAGFSQKILQFFTSIVGGVIFIVLLYGSFLVLTSAGDPTQLNRGKSMIRSGVIALLLIIFSVVILQFIGVQLLRLPGFG